MKEMKAMSVSVNEIKLNNYHQSGPQIHFNDKFGKNKLAGVFMNVAIGASIFVSSFGLVGSASNSYLNQNSYIECNKNYEGLNSLLDLNKIKNLEIIEKISHLKNNWNGNNALPFSSKSISIFKKIIENLNYQPYIAPTGRNSLYMEFKSNDNSMLAFEVQEDQVVKVFLPKGDFNLASQEVIRDNIYSVINESVDKFYE